MSNGSSSTPITRSVRTENTASSCNIVTAEIKKITTSSADFLFSDINTIKTSAWPSLIVERTWQVFPYLFQQLMCPTVFHTIHFPCNHVQFRKCLDQYGLHINCRFAKFSTLTHIIECMYSINSGKFHTKKCSKQQQLFLGSAAKFHGIWLLATDYTTTPISQLQLKFYKDCQRKSILAKHTYTRVTRDKTEGYVSSETGYGTRKNYTRFFRYSRNQLTKKLSCLTYHNLSRAPLSSNVLHPVVCSNQ